MNFKNLCLLLLVSVSFYTIIGGQSQKFSTSRKKEPISQQVILTLRQGIVAGDGIIFTADKKLVEEMLPTRTSDYQEKVMAVQRAVPTVFDGSLVVIASPWQYQWYHWLLQVLPKLYVIAQSGISYDKIYVNNIQYPWQRKSLEIVMEKLGIPARRLLDVNSQDQLIRATKLIVPALPYSLFQKNKIQLPSFLKKFLKSCFLVDMVSPSAKKIYISRSKAKVRRVLNEDRLIDYLRNKDFEILNLEDISIYDQARYFHNADIIVGPHGSAFSNLIFSRPGTALVEIDYLIPYAKGRHCFREMAKDMHCRYLPFKIEMAAGVSDNTDFHVDMQAFARFFEAAFPDLK